jgi:MFS family permease
MLADTRRLVGSLPAQVRLLIYGTLVNRMGSFIVPYLSLVLVREFDLAATQVAWLVAAYGGGSLVALLAGGVLTDSLGRRRTLLVSLLGSGTLALAMALAPDVRVFVPLLFAFAFVADLYRPASSALISDHLPSGRRAVGFAAMRVAVNLGFAVGMGLGGLLVDWNWRAMFAADGLTTLAFGLIVHQRILESRPTQAGVGVPNSVAGGPRAAPWRDGVLMLASASSLLFAIVAFTDFTVFPLTATLSAGYPAWLFGLLVGLNGVLIVLFEVAATERLRSYRRLRVAAAGYVITGVGLGLTGFVMHWSWFLIAILLWTAGEILAMPQQTAFIADWAPVEARGRYMGIYSATWSLAMLVNPLLFLPLHARLGERGFWPLLLLITLPGAAALWWLDKHADRPERLRGLASTGTNPTP